MFFQIRRCRNIKKQEYYKFLHIYCDADHARDISGRRSFTSTAHLINDTIIDLFSKKKYETSRSSSNA